MFINMSEQFFFVKTNIRRYLTEKRGHYVYQNNTFDLTLMHNKYLRTELLLLKIAMEWETHLLLI